MTIGKAIRILRVAREVSQGKLARAVGASPGYLSLVEREKREPSLSFLNRVAAYFGVPVGFLFLMDTDVGALGTEQQRLVNEIRQGLLEYVLSGGPAKKRVRKRKGEGK